MTYTLGGKSVTFNGLEPAGTNPYAPIAPHQNWLSELQWTFSLTRQSGGTDPTRKAINLLPVTAWGFYYCPEEAERAAQIPAPWR